jgi:hypothetical protein
MTRREIQRTQERIGTQPDGFWGPLSIAACQRHLRALMPQPARFPRAGTAAFLSRFGPPGVKGGHTPPLTKIRLPFAVYYGTTKLLTLSPNTACADSLLAVFHRLAETYPSTAARRAAGILTFDGIYNPRFSRNSSTWSLHAWAAAIDLDAARNPNRSAWPVASHMPIEVLEAFSAEGWLPAAAFWHRDAMHFQATA